MKTYEAYDSSPDGWNVSSTLELEDDGRFVYTEGRTDYANASLGGGAQGLWRREGDVIVFRAERAEGPMYFPWRVGQELKASAQGRALDFGNGWKLSEAGEREVTIPVRNNGHRPLTVRVEPWVDTHVLEPGEGLLIVARGPWGPHGPEVVRGGEEFVYYGWVGSTVEVVREPKPPKPSVGRPAVPEPPPGPAVRAAEFPRPKPLDLSPELASRLRRRIDGPPAEDVPDWVARICKENDAIPLHVTSIYLWALRADGQVLSIDHESFARRAEPENNAATASAALAQGARRYPELAELFAHDPGGLVECGRCGGSGRVGAAPPAEGTISCGWCDGMGWHEPRPPGRGQD